MPEPFVIVVDLATGQTLSPKLVSGEPVDGAHRETFTLGGEQVTVGIRRGG